MKNLFNNSFNLLTSEIINELKQQYSSRIKELIQKHNESFLEYLNEEMSPEASLLTIINKKITTKMSSYKFQKYKCIKTLQQINNHNNHIKNQIICAMSDTIFLQIKRMLLAEHKHIKTIPSILQ